MKRVAAALATALAIAATGAGAAGKKTVAVLEYRSGAKGAAGIGERLARALKANAAFDVIDPQEARRRVPRIDAEVARCSGDATCIAMLGAKLGADEVLLIGVSQLGDVVLAMQRIEVSKGEAGARLAESLPADSEPSDDDVLGWLRQLYPPEAFRRYGSVRIVADVMGARVELNGALAGETPIADPIKVRAPATYRLRVAKPQYVPFLARIDVLPEATVEVRASLVRENQPVPWFKRWYVWAAVGGALAITGVSLAVYFGTRVDETPMGFIQRPPR
jgi:PEGA domain